MKVVVVKGKSCRRKDGGKRDSKKKEVQERKWGFFPKILLTVSQELSYQQRESSSIKYQHCIEF